MTHFIDRRANPRNRSLGNRRRFIKRVRDAVKAAVDRSVKARAIADVDQGDAVTVSAGDIHEPSFRNARQGGHREYVLPGNRVLRTGDRIEKPPAGGGGAAGREGSDSGEATDDFVFTLSREEFLDLFFEDLELPDMVKRSLKRIESSHPHRAGFSVSGPPANLSVTRTMRKAIGRRIALQRPGLRAVADLAARIEDLERNAPRNDATRRELDRLRLDLERMRLRQRRVPYLDPVDLRYRHFDMRPDPTANAVMFCLMDVSASMGEREKDLAKRFFVLLHLFLKRSYERVELVFIRHTHLARAVDEETFFHSAESGGTVVSTALEEMQRIIRETYSPADWNIYAAQASDGENFSGDSEKCGTILRDELMRHCQYFAYVEIMAPEEAEIIRNPQTGTELWRTYLSVAEAWPNFAQKRIARPGDIYPVFRELFARETGHG